MFSSLKAIFFPLAFIVAVPFGSQTISAADPAPRSFRPIVPIARQVPNPSESSSEALAETRTLSVKLPPPVIPDPAESLFPEGSVPEIDLPPEPTLEADSTTSESEDQKEEADQTDGPTLSLLREEAHRLAEMGLTYDFGSDDPDKGGLDCSGAMQYLLKKIGVDDVPRTSYQQYYWLKKEKTLDDISGKNASSKLLKKLSPGDLIFWGGTWKSGHRVSHVMLYMGYDPSSKKHYVFGARGKKSKGLLGHGVDIFELDPDRGRLVAHGKIPGLSYDS